MNEILKRISLIGVVPVVSFDDVSDALPVANSLRRGGINSIEVTFRTDCAAEAIRRISNEYEDMIVGAGTVLNKEQVDAAIENGAKFIVTPGFNPKVVEYCVSKNITVIPGCTNPSDIEMAIEFGLDTVKFFPAESYGGIKTIKALSQPYKNVNFIPTGGINMKNMNDYLSFDRVLAIGGSWMVDKELIKNRQFDRIEALSREAVENMLGFEIGHVGINMNGEVEALGVANYFERMFGFNKIDMGMSYFASSFVEVMKAQFLGSKGHIAIKTFSVERSMYYLASKGVEFLDETLKVDENGRAKSVYLKGEVGGFAIHLVRK